ncbi:DUF11 domain-containing protein [Chitinophaga sp. Mgbs1]|uniref:DUF11 domain-containing protein n=1 Tax=Chitinophaga solisilvae TaxID=1233460 RepID=A0A9Q5D0H9_9BACT|nr:DUF11 domain-containing protein [Chitinophaga solisilvae]
MKRILLLLCWLLLLVGGNLEAQTKFIINSAGTPYALRYQDVVRGGVLVAGNANVVRTRTVPYSYYIDIDGDPVTFNSSSENLTIPAGATVKKAFLYWQSNCYSSGAVYNISNPPAGRASFTHVKLKTPSSSAYTDLIPDIAWQSNTYFWQGMKDVTALVQQSGTYTVANIDSDPKPPATNGYPPYAGWSLWVEYAYPNTDISQSYRMISLTDGFKYVTGGSNDVTSTGFKVPESAAVAIDGEAGWFIGGANAPWNDAVTYNRPAYGASPALNNFFLSDGANPANNPLNESRSYRGTPVTSGRNPASSFSYTNAASGNEVAFPWFDLDVIDISALLVRGQTQYTLKFYPQANGAPGGCTAPYGCDDWNQPGYVYTSIRVVPPIAVNDTVTTPVNVAVTIPVLNNDIAVGDALDPSTVTITQQPSNGVLTVNADGTVTYTPNAGFTGEDTFKYTVRDVTGSLSNEATVLIRIGAKPVLGIVKTADRHFVNPGNQVTFTITLSNTGSADSLGVKVIEKPVGFTYVSSSASSGSYDNSTRTWTVDALKDSTETLTLVMTADATGPYGNVAGIGDPDDPVNPRDTTRFSTLSIKKTADKGSVRSGDTVTFTVTVKNSGQKDTLGLEVLDISEGFTYVSSSLTTGTYNSGDGIWTLDALQGSTHTLTLVMKANAAGPYSNVAAIGDPGDPDDPSDTAKFVVPGIQKVSDKSSIRAGDTVTFTVTVTNSGLKDTLGLQVTDQPQGFTYVSSSTSTGTYNSGSNVWTLDALKGSTQILTLVMTANASGPYGNVVVAGDPTDPVNPRDTAKFAVIGVKKVADKNNVRPGDTVTFTVTVTNSGLKDTLGLQVTDQPQGFTYVSSSTSTGTYNSGSNVWTLDALKGSTQTLTLVMTANASGPYGNVVVAGDPTDPVNPRDTAKFAVIGVKKVADKNNVRPGDTVTFTVTVTNSGLKDTLGLQVTDQPQGFTYVSSSTSTGTYNSGSNVWTLDALKGSTQTLILVMTANASGPYGNVVVAGDPTDPVNPRDTAKFAVIGVKKVADKNNVRPGDTVTFTVTVTNSGLKDTLGLQVTDQPQGFTYVSSSTSTGTYNSGSNVWTLDALKGSTQTLTLVMTANASGPYGNVVVAGDPTDPTNPRDTAKFAVISVRKVSDKSNIKPGEQVTFTVTVSNSGLKDTLGLQVTDQPQGFTYVSSSVSTGSYNSGSGVWTLDALKGSTQTLTLVMTANASGPYGNIAVAGDPTDPTNPRDTAKFAVISVKKVADKNNIKPGEQVTFTVTVANSGLKDTLGLQVTDQPQGFTYVSSSVSTGSYNSGSGVWTLDALKGSTQTLTLVMTANASGPYGNVAVAGDPTDPTNPRDTAKFAVISVKKVADKSNIKPGEQVTFTVTVSNSGLKDTLGLQVTDQPQGFTYVSSSTSTGTYNSGSGIWTLDALKGSTQTLTLVMTANASGPYGNVAVAGDPTDPTNPRDTAKFAVISVKKVADKSNIKPGEQVTFTVTVSNSGLKDTLGLQVTDQPQGFTYVSSSTSTGTYNSGSGIWTLDALKGSTQTLTLVMTANASGPYGNVAVAGDPTDPTNPRDTAKFAVISVKKVADKNNIKPGEQVTFTVTVANSGLKDTLGLQVTDQPQGFTYVSSSTITGTYNSGSGVWTLDALKGSTQTLTLVMTANASGPYSNVAVAGDPTDPTNPRDTAKFAVISVKKVADKSNVKPGEQVTFTVTVSNSGLKDTLGLQVTDQPQGFTYVSSSVSTGSYNSGSGVWTLDALKGSTQTLTVVMTANASGPYGNVAVAGDPTDPTNPRDTAKFAVISVKKVADKNNIKPGEQVTFTVTVANSGLKDTLGLQVTDQPQGFTYVSSSVSTGSYNSGDGIWTLDALKGSTQTLTLVMTANASGPYGNVAVAGDPTDPTNPRDTAKFAVISVRKVSDKSNIKPGEQVTFTVTVANSGLKDTLGLQVTDQPQGFTYVSSSVSTGSYNSGSGVWTLDALKGSTQTLTLVMTANASGPYGNVAVAGDPTDPTNPRDTAKFAVISVKKVSDKSNIKPGEQVTFTVTVANSGLKDTLGLQVTDQPQGFTYVSSSTSTGMYNSGSNVWTLDALKGSTQTLTLVMTANASGPYGNVAVAGDPTDPTNPRDTAKFAVISVRKVSDKSNIKPGEQVTFTVTVSNSGLKDTLGLQVTDQPQGFTYVSSSTSTGTYNSGSGVWTLDALKGSTQTLTLVMTANASGPYGNIAVAGDPTDPTNPRDTAKFAIISVKKVADKSSIKPGEQVTFTVTVSNSGLKDTLGLQVTDQPQGFSYVSSSTSTGTYNSGSGVWILDALKGSTQTLILVMTANASGPYSNVAVAGDPTDPTNPRDTAKFAVISVKKVSDKSNIKPGEQVTFTVTVTNSGLKDTLGLQVTDQPQGFSYVSSSTSTGTYNSGSGVWTLDALKGSKQTLTLVMTANASGPYGNVAVAGDPTDPTNPRDTAKFAVISVKKVADKSNIKPGEQVTFTVTVANSGLKDTLGLQVTDQPQGFTYVSSNTSTGTYNSGSGVWTLDALKGSTQTLTLVMTANASGPYGNVAVAGDPTDPTNPRDTAKFAVISVRKVADKSNIKPGEQVTFTVTVANSGLKDTLGLQVTDQPQGFTYVSSNTSTGTYNSGSGVWTLDALKGSMQTLTLVLRANASGPYGNVAVAGDPTDPTNPRDTAKFAVISVKKVADKSNVKPGEQVTFTVTVANSGLKDTLGLQVTDQPQGFTYVSSNTSTGTYNSGDGIWTLDALKGRTQTLILVMRANVSGPYGNVAVAGDPTDPTNPRDTAKFAVIGVKKVADKNNVRPGDTVTFTVTVTNSGLKDTLGLQVTDQPQGFTYVSSSTSTGTYNSGNGIWTLDALKGSTQTLTLVMRANASGPYSNIAVAGDPTDPTNPRDTARFAVISVKKVADKSNIKPGEQVTFTVTVANSGLKDTLGLQVTDQPQGFTYVSSSTSTGTYNSGSNVWTLDALKGSTQTLTLVMTANASGPYGNVAVAGDPTDPTNPRDTAKFAVISVKKVADKNNIKPGERVTFTVTVTNSGLKDTLGLQVTDQPQGFTYVSSSVSTGSYNSGSGVWTLDALKGSTQTLTLVMTANASGPYGNVAVAGDPTDPTNPRDTAKFAIISVKKVSDKSSIKPGEQVTFTVTVSNTGLKDTLGLQVTDQPQGFTYVSSSTSTGTYNSGNGIWTLDALKGSTQTLTLVMRANASGPYSNIAVAGDPTDPTNPRDTAKFGVISVKKVADKSSIKPGEQVIFTVTVTNSGLKDTLGLQVTDQPQGFTYVSSNTSTGTYNSGDGIWTLDALKSSTQTLTLVMRANANGAYSNVAVAGDPTDPTNPRDTAKFAVISVKKVADKSSIKPGEQVIFTVTVTNSGLKDTLGLQVTDQPQGFTYVSSNTSTGTYNSGDGIWTLDALKSSTQTLTLVMRANANGAYSNVAVAGDPTDPTNPRDTAKFAVISVKKVADKSSIKPGEQVTFTVTVSNSGLKDTLGLQVTDQPQGFTYVSSNTSTGIYNSGNGIWTLDALKGSTQTLTLVMRANASGPYSNVAVAGDPTDPANPRDTAKFAVISVKKVADKSNVKPGEQVTFTVTVSNSGLKDTSGLQVTDQPQGFTYVSSSTSIGTYNSGSGVWTLDALKGSTQTLTLVLRANASGPYSNIAVAGDPTDPTNPRDTAKFAVISVKKVANKSNIKPGEQVTFTVTVTNSGLKDTLGLQVTDQPQGFSYVSSSTSTGTYNSGSGVWTLDVLKGSTQTLTLVMTANASGPYSNVAVAGDPTDPTNPRDTAKFAVISVKKVADKSNIKPGEQVTFTVTVANSGLKDTLGLQVTDQPQGFTYVSSSVSTGSYNSGSGVWTLDALKGSTQTLTLVMTANASGPYGNVAVAGDPTDPTNPRDTAKFAVISVRKVSDKSNIKPGEQVTFTVTVANSGLKDTLGLQVTDQPQGFTYVSSSVSTGSYNSVSGVWTLDALKGSAQTLTLVMTANASGPYGNVAVAGDPTDPTSPRDTAKFAITSVKKVADKSSIKPGEQVTFTVTVSNSGLKDTLGLQVTDQPQGFTYVSSSVSTGSYNSGSGVWTLDALKGSTQTLTLVMTANVRGPYSNVAVAGDPTDPTNPRDTAKFAVISVKKVADKSNIKPGEQVTFTVTVSNSGLKDTLGLQVTDQPQGFTYVSSSTSTGTYNSGSGVWTLDALKGSTQTLTLVMTANASGPYSNVAVASDPTDPTNPRDTAKFAVISVKKVADKSNIKPGEQVTFTVTVSNSGLKDTLGLQVTDQPQGFTYVSSSTSTGTYNSGSGVWTLDALKGSTQTLTLVLRANASGPYSNVAVAGDPTDPTNPRDTVKFAVISVKKVADKSNIKPGEQVTFTVTVSNSGLKDTLGLQVTDQPQGFTYVSSNTSTGTYNSGDGIWTLDALKGSTQTLTLVMRANASGPYSNIAVAGDPTDPTSPRDTAKFAVISVKKVADKSNVKPGEQVTFTVTVTNSGLKDTLGLQVTDQPQGFSYVSSSTSTGTYNSGSGVWTLDALKGSTQTLTLVMTANASGPYSNVAVAGDPTDPTNPRDTAKFAIISVKKVADKNNIKPGEQVTFTVTVSNSGLKDTLGLQVTDQPQGFTYVSSSTSTGTYNSGSGVWTLDALKGSTQTLTLVMRANASGPYSNVAVAGDPTDPTNPRDTAKFAVISVKKVADKSNVKPGEQVTFTVTVSNSGLKDTSGLQVTDQPQGFTYVSSSVSTGSYNNGNGVWTLDALKGSTQTLTLVMRANASAPYSNVAVAGDPTDPTNPRDTAKFVTISIKKIADKSSVKPGEQVTFTITVTNSGLKDTVGLQVTDQPQGFTYISSNTSTGTYNSSSGVWTLNALKGSTQILTLVMRTNATGPYGNIAIAGDPTDPTNPRDTVKFTAISLKKTADKSNIQPGDQVSFTVTVTNNGLKDTLGLQVTDLPQGFTYISSNTSTGAYNSGSGIWTLNALKGSTQTLTLLMRANATGPYLNTVHTGNPADPNSLRDTVRFVALAISKTADRASIQPGEKVTFTIRLHNAGTKDTLGVRVQDLPAGLSYVSHNTTAGTYNSATGIWTTDALQGTAQTLTLIMEAGITGPYKNTAATGNLADSVLLSAAQVNLSIVKTIRESGPYVSGQKITYQLTVRNAGPATATGVVVNDVLVKDLAEPRNIQPDTGTTLYDPLRRMLTWNIGSLGAGTTATLTMVTMFNNGGDIANTATVSGNETDTDPSDNTSVVTAKVTGDIFIPNTITPNGDGKNDKFVIPGLERYPGSRLEIYNRWGNQVYFSNNYANNWDGYGLNEGTYFYVLKLKTPSKVMAYTGWILLIR